MRPELVSVLWVVEGSSREPPEFVTKRDVGLTEVSFGDLERAIRAARERGGVVAVGPTEEAADADLFLAMGADELLGWDCTPAQFDVAVRRARARAIWRAGEVQAAAADELSGLALLGGAMGHEIRNPLTAATINCTVLEEVVPSLTEALEELAGDSGSKRDDEGFAHIRALAKETRMQDVRDALSDLGSALRSVSHVVTEMVTFSEDEAVDVCDLTRVLVDLTSLIHRDVERWAEFVVEIPDKPCVVAMSRRCALEVVSSLLSNATQALSRSTGRGLVELRLSNESGMIVVEVSDNGSGMAPDVRRRALNPFFSTHRPGPLGFGLTFAALRVRRAGGEILIDSEPGVGTHVRLFFPPALTVVAAPDRAN